MSTTIRYGAIHGKGARVCVLSSLLLILLLIAPICAHADQARDDLRRAEREFNQANFGGALAIVNRLTAEGSLSSGDLRDAFALKARCEGELGNRTDALAAFCQVIALDPEWKPDRTLFTSGEMAIFEEARGECAVGGKGDAGGRKDDQATGGTGGGSSRKWWYIGGGAIVAGLVLALIGGGGDDGPDPVKSDLPDFPSPPES